MFCACLFRSNSSLFNSFTPSVVSFCNRFAFSCVLSYFSSSFPFSVFPLSFAQMTAVLFNPFVKLILHCTLRYSVPLLVFMATQPSVNMPFRPFRQTLDIYKSNRPRHDTVILFKSSFWYYYLHIALPYTPPSHHCQFFRLYVFSVRIYDKITKLGTPSK